MTCGDIFLGFLAILFPPIAVWIKSGLCSADSLINILLCCLGYLPGLLHAWYIISRNPEQDYDYEAIPNAESGERVTYYYVRHEPGRLDYGTAQQQAPQGQNRPAPPPPKPKNKPTTSSNNNNSNGQGSSRPAPPPPSQPAEGPSVGAGGQEPGAPPSYSEVVRGDNKIQSQD